MKPEQSYSYRMLEGFLISLRWFFLLLTSTVIFHSSARLCQMHFSPPSQFFAPNFLNLPKSWTQTMPSNFGKNGLFLQLMMFFEAAVVSQVWLLILQRLPSIYHCSKFLSSMKISFTLVKFGASHILRLAAIKVIVGAKSSQQ